VLFLEKLFEEVAGKTNVLIEIREYSGPKKLDHDFQSNPW
jgi:hypothetical protein